jgi:hypothetical protein
MNQPASLRSDKPAEINRSRRPQSIGIAGRNQTECPAEIIGIRNARLSALGLPFSPT